MNSLGWAAAWSNWELVLALMDALEPNRAHTDELTNVVIVAVLILTTCFYLQYGPEPIIPDPALQQVCYNHGYSSSLRRSLMSYMLFSCVVIVVMCCVDPTYGLFSHLAKALYNHYLEVFDAKALLVLMAVVFAISIICACLSGVISWATEVDGDSSIKLSRSVHNACQRMVRHRRSNFDALLTQVLEDSLLRCCFLLL